MSDFLYFAFMRFSTVVLSAVTLASLQLPVSAKVSPETFEHLKRTDFDGVFDGVGREPFQKVVDAYCFAADSNDIGTGASVQGAAKLGIRGEALMARMKFQDEFKQLALNGLPGQQKKKVSAILSKVYMLHHTLSCKSLSSDNPAYAGEYQPESSSGVIKEDLELSSYPYYGTDLRRGGVYLQSDTEVKVIAKGKISTGVITTDSWKTHTIYLVEVEGTDEPIKGWLYQKELRFNDYKPQARLTPRTD